MRKVRLNRRFRGVYYIVNIKRWGMSLCDRLEDAYNRAPDPGRVRIAKVDRSELEKEM